VILSQEGEGRLYDLRGFNSLLTLTEPKGIADATFGFSGRDALTISRDGVIRRWNVGEAPSSSVIKNLGTPGLQASFGGDGTFVFVSSGAERYISSVYRTSRSAPFQQWITPDASATSEHGTTAVMLAPLLGGARTRITLWNASINGAFGGPVALQCPEKVYDVWLVPDGSRLFASEGNASHMWNLNGIITSVHLESHSTLRNFTPDSTRVLVGTDEKLRLYAFDFRGIVKALRDQTSACLTTDQRVQLLGERPTAATESYRRCERSKGR
jgi:WD40 repeat protein